MDEKFWLAVAFTIFIIAIYKILGSKINNILNEKSQQIANDILLASQLKEKAEKLLQQAQEYHDQSLYYVKQLNENTSNELNTLKNNAKASLNAELDKMLAISKQRLANEEQIAIRTIKENIIKEAIKIISNANFDSQQHQQLIIKSLQNLENI